MVISSDKRLGIAIVVVAALVPLLVLWPLRIAHPPLQLGHGMLDLTAFSKVRMTIPLKPCDLPPLICITRSPNRSAP
jgi:hypothetical protein